MAAPRVRKIPHRYGFDLVPLVTERGTTKVDWCDDKLLFSDCLPLKVLDNDEAVAKIKEMIDGLAYAMDEKIAYTIILLAWNMRSDRNPAERIFPEDTAVPITGNESSLSELQLEPFGMHPTIPDPIGLTNTREFIRAGCYLAASLLKLFTKSSASWLKAQDHLKSKYKKFTDRDFDLGRFDVWAPSVEVLRRLYHSKMIYRKTLGHILYFTKTVTVGRGMTQMLYEQHLAFTGMHIVELFCKASAGLGAPPSMLLNALFTTQVESHLDQLAHILSKFMSSNKEGLSRETYKYARLYEPQMFALLQTKNCTDLVCILAGIGKLCGNVGDGDVMEIAVISNIGEHAKKIYKRIAQNIFNYFKETMPASREPRPNPLGLGSAR